MRPSGDLVKRTWSERAKTPASEELQPAVSQKSDTAYRETLESTDTNEERTVRAERQRKEDGQEVCNLEKRAVLVFKSIPTSVDSKNLVLLYRRTGLHQRCRSAGLAASSFSKSEWNRKKGRKKVTMNFHSFREEREAATTCSDRSRSCFRKRKYKGKEKYSLQTPNYTWTSQNVSLPIEKAKGSLHNLSVQVEISTPRPSGAKQGCIY